ncbi:MAG: metalloregulator ArsR/SmtB family transcription factor [Anaerolineae bacterium]
MSKRTVDFARALADATRQKIMQLCCCEWRSVGDIADKIGVTQPTVSHHLAVLRDAGLVEAREEGRQTFYMLNQEHVVFCCGQLMNLFAPEEPATKEIVKLTPR